MKKMDIDGDGYTEAEVYTEDGKIIKSLIDEDHDGKIDTTVDYKNGYRDTAEKSTRHNGIVDVWIKYYFNGVPSMIARDANGDGKPDYWRYTKNGFVYKREWDRNHDGKPDVRFLYDVKPDLRLVADENRLIEREYDRNFDGSFETVQTNSARNGVAAKVTATAGASDEV